MAKRVVEQTTAVLSMRVITRHTLLQVFGLCCVVEYVSWWCMHKNAQKYAVCILAMLYAYLWGRIENYSSTILTFPISIALSHREVIEQCWEKSTYYVLGTVFSTRKGIVKRGNFCSFLKELLIIFAFCR